MISFPTNRKYSIILADCPWTYDDKALAGNRGVSCKYDLMTNDEIKLLPVKDIAVDNCFLFLWATEPLIQEGLDVVKAWGFDYKTFAFTWIKKTSDGKDFVGMGHYTRANPEICLLGVKGKVNVLDHSIRKLQYSKVRKHSKKPDLIREKILKLCGDLPRIELFARTKVHGWTCIGDEVDGQDIKISLEQIATGTYNNKSIKEDSLDVFL